jgi:hypothetical protein
MNYYLIQFPVDVSLIVATEVDETELLLRLHTSIGIRTRGSSIFNPCNFLSINRLQDVDARQANMVLTLDEALID